MYYKIVNKNSEVYKRLHELRAREIQIEKGNKKAIEKQTGLKFDGYLGCAGQQNYWRVTQYYGFKFLKPEKVDLKVWQKDKKNTGVFVPNRKTKAGREMQEFLSNGLSSSNFKDVFNILNLPCLSKFVFPYVEIFGDVIALFLDDKHEPKDENVIEITKKEFETIR